MKVQKEQIATVSTRTQTAFLTPKFVQATRIHWELVDVVDFYGEKREEKPRTDESRARTHLEILFGGN